MCGQTVVFLASSAYPQSANKTEMALNTGSSRHNVLLYFIKNRLCTDFSCVVIIMNKRYLYEIYY